MNERVVNTVLKEYTILGLLCSYFSYSRKDHVKNQNKNIFYNKCALCRRKVIFTMA